MTFKTDNIQTKRSERHYIVTQQNNKNISKI